MLLLFAEGVVQCLLAIWVQSATGRLVTHDQGILKFAFLHGDQKLTSREQRYIDISSAIAANCLCFGELARTVRQGWHLVFPRTCWAVEENRRNAVLRHHQASVNHFSVISTVLISWYCIGTYLSLLEKVLNKACSLSFTSHEVFLSFRNWDSKAKTPAQIGGSYDGSSVQLYVS